MEHMEHGDFFWVSGPPTAIWCSCLHGTHRNTHGTRASGVPCVPWILWNSRF